MFDPTNEKPLTALEACRHPLLQRGDRPLNRSVLERWMAVGILAPFSAGERVRLESYRFGGRRMTTVEAIRRFHTAVNGADPCKPNPHQIRREHDRADAELEAAGV